MMILDHINPISFQSRVEVLEGCEHVAHHVAAIVQDDVGRTELVEEGLQEFCVLLGSDANLDLILFVVLALRDDVDSDNCGMWAKIPLPHLKRATEPTTDL
jgi:hypothetical protein